MTVRRIHASSLPVLLLLPLSGAFATCFGCGGGSGASGSSSAGGADVDSTGRPFVAATPSPLSASPALEAFREGTALARAGRHEEAVERLERALDLDPARPEIALSLGQALVASSAINLGYDTRDRERMAEAIAYLDRARRQAPADADVHFWLGQAYYEVKLLDEAIAVLEQALALDPEHARARLRLGAIHLENGAAAEGRAVLGTSRADGFELDADQEQLELLWGMLLELENDREGAAAAYARAIALGRSNENPRFLLGTLLAKLGRRDEAQAEFARYEEIKERKDEVNSLERRARRADSDPNLWLQAGIARAQLGQLTRAKLRLQRVLDLSPGDPRAHFWLGIVAREEQRLEDARMHLEVVVRADDKAFEPRLALGEVLLALEDASAALTILRRATTLNPASADAQAALCSAALSAGEPETAASALAGLRRAAPEDARIEQLVAQLARASEESNR